MPVPPAGEPAAGAEFLLDFYDSFANTDQDDEVGVLFKERAACTGNTARKGKGSFVKARKQDWNKDYSTQPLPYQVLEAALTRLANLPDPTPPHRCSKLP